MTRVPSLKEALAAYRFGQGSVGFVGTARLALAPISLTTINPHRVKYSTGVYIALGLAIAIVDY